MRRLPVPGSIALLGVLLVGCLPGKYPSRWDFDGDGYPNDEDCEPADPEIHPGADDPVGDAIDQDCDGLDGSDADDDGSVDSVDCDDEDSTVYPGAPDPWGDGVDQDCDDCPEGSPDDAGDGIDRDCDGYAVNTDVPAELQDCDDGDAAVHPGAPELCDGADTDCSGTVDDLWECDPGNCGEGTWGWLPLDSTTVFVDASAAAGGDGTETSPFTRVQDGLDAAASSGDERIVVAAGTYAENLVLGAEHDGLHLAGRCADLVILDGSGGESFDAGILAVGTLGDERWELSGLTVSGAPFGGVRLERGTLEVSHTTVDDNELAGIVSQWVSSELMLDHVEVSDTLADPNENYGYGLWGLEGARIEAAGCLLENNTSQGLVAFDSGTTVQLVDSVIRDTRPSPSGSDGYGVAVTEGAALDATGSLIEGNTGVGLWADGIGTDVSLSSCTLVGTHRPSDRSVALGIEATGNASVTAEALAVSGTEGPGLYVASDANVICTSCDLDDNTFAGAVVQGGDLTLAQSSITGTVADASEGGGVALYCDATLGESATQASDSTFADHEVASIWLDGPGTFYLLSNAIEGGVGEGAGAGDGLVATDGVEYLALASNEFHDASRAGILLDGSTAQLSNNTFTNNTTDLVWQRCDGLAEPSGHGDVPVYDDRCGEAELPVRSLEFDLALGE